MFSNVFRRMMTSITIMKQPLVSASDIEAVTNIKMLQFQCTWSLKHSCTHFDVVIPKKKYPEVQLHACGSARYDALVLARKIIAEALNRKTVFRQVAM